MDWFTLILIAPYIVLIAGFVLGQGRLPEYQPKTKKTFKKFSILIPFRNEEANLARLLQAIAQLDYNLAHYEVFLINDDSHDRSLQQIGQFTELHPHVPISCLESVRTSGSPKKDALSLGVQHSQYEWIITTDADCIFPSSWLHTLNSFIQDKHPKMIAGPVAIATASKTSLRLAFEQLDILSLMGATMGGFGIQSPFLCNGAHLIYEKKAFLEQDGFTNNTHIASGDDHFLLEKFVRAYPQQVHYLKTPQAIITTQAQQSWRSLVSQRVRWASKTSAYRFWFSKMVGIVVLLANLLTAILLVSLPVLLMADLLLANALSLPLLLIILLLKWSIDYVLIARAAGFFDRNSYLKWYPIIALFYPFITVYIVIISIISPYEWKGRWFSK